jgi:hypothetical protein
VHSNIENMPQIFYTRTMTSPAKATPKYNRKPAARAEVKTEPKTAVKPVAKIPKVDPVIAKTNEKFFGTWTDQEAKAFAKRLGRKL